MASVELLQSWARTTALLTKARSLLSPAVVREHDADLTDVSEFLDNNELGIAFDWLFSIIRESQPDARALLSTMLLAAENMDRIDDTEAIRQRLLELD